MGAYAGTPTVNYKYEIGDRFGNRVGVIRNLTLTISSQGGATNSIGAVALGLAASKIYRAVLINYTDGSSQNRGISVWTDGSIVLLGDPQVATAGDRCEPLDMTGTLQIEVFGLPV